MTDRTYCGSAVADSDSVFVAEGLDCDPAGAFCNYACLAAHIEDAELTTGAFCRGDPEV